MRDYAKGKKSVAICLALLIPCAVARGQSTHWNAAAGDWSQDANWTDGEPGVDTRAYVGSPEGRSTAAVAVVQAGEECWRLYLGEGEGNKGTLTIEPQGTLTAQLLFVGHNGTGAMRQTGGICTVDVLSVGWGDGIHGSGFGEYEMVDGALDAGWIVVADGMAMSGRYVQRGGAVTTAGMGVTFIHAFPDVELHGGTLTNSGRLNMDMFVSFEQYGGRHEVAGFDLYSGSTYEKRGGELIVTDSIALHKDSNFVQYDGNTHVRGDVTVEGPGDFSVHAGDLRVDGNMLVVEDQSPRRKLEFLNAGDRIAVGGVFTLRGPIDLTSAVGAQLDLTGPGFVNEMPETAGAAAGLGQLALVYEGGTGLVATHEAAGEDIGPDPNGLVGNYTIGTLRIGGEDDVGVVQLVDDFENAAGDALPEAVYVERLVVEPGCTLDLNGLNLYYVTGGVDPAGTVLLHGGNLIQVPEPTAAWLLILGGLTFVQQRRRKRGLP